MHQFVAKPLEGQIRCKISTGLDRRGQVGILPVSFELLLVVSILGLISLVLLPLQILDDPAEHPGGWRLPISALTDIPMPNSERLNPFGFG